MQPRPQDAASTRYVRFPPRWHNVLVPVAPSAATTVGMSLYTASRTVPVLLQQGLWLGARLTGARLLPGHRETWTPPVPDEVWDQLVRQWRAVVGRPIDGIAIYERLQSQRAALTLMVCAGAASALVRVRPDPAEFAHELSVSRAAATTAPDGFRVPAAVGSGVVDGHHWVAFEALATRPHRPRYRVPDPTFDAISRLVESVVARPDGTPGHWRGAHGDLVPWNLRVARGATWLIDWEEAGWEPPGLDRLYLRATVASMRPGPVRRLAVAPAWEEARLRLLDIVAAQPNSDAELRSQRRLLTVLGSPRGAA